MRNLNLREFGEYIYVVRICKIHRDFKRTRIICKKKKKICLKVRRIFLNDESNICSSSVSLIAMIKI